MFLKIKNQKIFFIWLNVFLVIFFIIPLIFTSIYFTFEKKYHGKIYPGVYVGAIDLGGKNTNEALKILNEQINNINQDGIIFYYDYYQATLFPLVSSTEGDIAYQIISFDAESTVNKAFDIGRNQDFLNNLKIKLNTLINKKSLNLIGNINKEEVNDFLAINFGRFETPPIDAQLEFVKKTKEENAKFIVIEEKYGQVLDYEKALQDLMRKINNFSSQSIELQAGVKSPDIYKKDCINIDAKAKALYNQSPLFLNHENKEWAITKEDFVNWLKLKKEGNEEISVGLDYQEVKKYLEDNIASETNVEPIKARFEMLDNKVSEFQVSRDGKKLNAIKTAANIENELKKNNNKIELIVEAIKSDITVDKLDELGIKEIIGTGRSKYAGSPRNRKYNIQIGASAINGLLIEPDKEFSLVEALGEIDKESGYLPELVIKGNKTIPEYGGGLCQIGTTLFRTVYNSGLPVTMRRNHSYRVSYYEPAGTDATIYNPWPDFRFVNDTGKHILIQTHINENEDEIWFDFWGTNDGRVASASEPVIYNIVKPGPTKIIESLDLEPGERKCTESAHNGASAYFDYSVTYPDGEVKTERFKSHYVPWREVCLVGVEELSEEDNKTASGTTEIFE